MSSHSPAGGRVRRVLWAVGIGAGLGGLSATLEGSAAGLVLAVALAVAAVGVGLWRSRLAREGRAPPPDGGGARSWFAAAALALGIGTAVRYLLTGRLAVPDVLLWVALLSSFPVHLALLRFRRTDEGALRDAHPGAPVVRARLADDGSLQLARWAKAVGVGLPAALDDDLLLVATDDGLGLWTSRWPRRDPRRLAVLPWDDVALERRQVPGAWPAASWAVLTLRGPAASSHARAVPRARSKHPVSLLLYDGSSPVTGADAVERTISHLTGGGRPRR